MNETYTTLPAVDLALGRAVLRRATEVAKGNETAVMIYGCQIDRLLDRRLDLMRGAA